MQGQEGISWSQPSTRFSSRSLLLASRKMFTRASVSLYANLCLLKHVFRDFFFFLASCYMFLALVSCYISFCVLPPGRLGFPALDDRHVFFPSWNPVKLLSRCCYPLLGPLNMFSRPCPPVMVDTQLFINNQRVCKIRVFRYNGLSPTRLLKVNRDLVTRIFPPLGTVHFFYEVGKKWLLFSNATFTGTRLHIYCRRVRLHSLCCCGSLSPMLQKAAMLWVSVYSSGYMKVYT